MSKYRKLCQVLFSPYILSLSVSSLNCLPVLFLGKEWWWWLYWWWQLDFRTWTAVSGDSSLLSCFCPLILIPSTFCKFKRQVVLLCPFVLITSKSSCKGCNWQQTRVVNSFFIFILVQGRQWIRVFSLRYVRRWCHNQQNTCPTQETLMVMLLMSFVSCTSSCVSDEN